MPRATDRCQRLGLAHKSQVVAATLLAVAWAGSVLSALIAYGVAEMYASGELPGSVRNGNRP